MMRARFDELCTGILDQLRPGEDATLRLDAEASDFVRFNRGRVRQPGHVVHGRLTLRLIRGARHASMSLNLAGEGDRARARQALERLRELVEVVPEDPHLLWEKDGRSTERVQPGEPAAAEAIVDAVVREAAELDLVGILAAGEMAAGFASSRGQRNWDQRHGWLFDWCVYDHGDKAVKSTLGGADFDPAGLREQIRSGREQLRILQQPVRTLSPGDHRVFLAPAALAELVELMGMDGFSHRAHQTHNSALGRLGRGEALLSPRLSIAEDVAGGLAAGFSGDGFARPDRIPLVDGGELVGTLVSPRSAVEYGVATNGAGNGEQPDSVHVAGGELPTDQALAALGTGLYVSNLWYLNFSDHPKGRVTGMTRFSTLWVEDGRPVAPTEVMRFDDTLFHLLGEGLEGLTREVSTLPSASTYGMRSSDSARVPGALIDGMTFTL